MIAAGSRRRRAALALMIAVSAWQAARAEQRLDPALAADLRSCARALGTDGSVDVFGTRRVDIRAACPTLAERLAARPLPVMQGRRAVEDGGMSMRNLLDITRLVESAAEPRPFVGQLSSVRLGLILDSLDPASRGELSTRARLARWWRSVVGEFDPSQRAQRTERRRIAWPLGFWSTLSWVSFAIAALLVLTVLVQELRALMGLRGRARGAPMRVQHRRDGPPDLAALDALPPRQRAGALLRAVSERLHERGALTRPDPLTPREIDRAARLRPEERTGLRSISSVAEEGAYGRDEPSGTALARARAAAVAVLAQRGPLARWRAAVLRGDGQGGA